ncbi:ABC transporter ATP-binding protein [Acidiferrimicrobium sp. IK]|uniref:ABC transporter ATP-binding protein n=1 Tax=Acidiferrimicrobium sp. IK TaxID=2871700 RepID=UPI0021CAF58E|nr:ABC transporter ATP-binding protein [Acidiferrimicrobium sp. IK]MCU4183528.1 ABC transporter ATP-binding protein [Acidiferrimicrobium sp. IK]
MAPESEQLATPEEQADLAAEGIVLRDDAPLLEVTDLTVDFPTDDGIVHAVRGVSFSLAEKEVLAIVGESGSGKSVTSLAIMGLLGKTARISGSVKYRGVELIGMKNRKLAKIRGRGLAMIFQDPMTSLNPVYRVGWQLAEAIRAHNKISKHAAMERSVELLRMVGIPNPEERVRSFPHEFSGGMRQRAVIAIAVANSPDVIIADEPTTALDVTVQAQVLEAMEEARRHSGAGMVLITHDLGVVAGSADKVLVMYAGRPVEFGSVDDIFYRPRMPYTVGLLGAMPRLSTESDGRLVPVPGNPPSLINLPPGCPFSPRCPLSEPACNEAEPDLTQVGAGHRAACRRIDAVPALVQERLGHVETVA